MTFPFVSVLDKSDVLAKTDRYPNFVKSQKFWCFVYIIESDFDIAEYQSLTTDLANLSNWEFTMWKFQDFSATQILRELNLGESKNSKITIYLTIL